MYNFQRIYLHNYIQLSESLFVSKDGNDLASIVIESGMLPRAVKIGTPNDNDKSKTALTVDAYQVHASKQIAQGDVV